MPDRDEVRKMMNKIDINGDGLIQKDELKIMVVQIMKSMTEKEDEKGYWKWNIKILDYPVHNI